MAVPPALDSVVVCAPWVLMAAMALFARTAYGSIASLWRLFLLLSGVAVVISSLAVLTRHGDWYWTGVARATTLGQILAVLVQLLGTIIGSFSARYLQGEAGQRGYVVQLTTVLASVHVLLLADHWLILIAAWACIGAALQHLLLFYADRPFALLAVHKKRMADRIADALLLTAGALAWREAGSGSLSDLWLHIARHGLSLPLQASAFALVLAVVVRTALLPVHGWLIQVMEAPTPVSALLHAGVVNLGGFVLIRFAPLLEGAVFARSVLMALGLATAVLAGMVMLTRISIKVRLAWSTTAQMGFMLLECALGLYELAAMHLIGHSLYKAHAFLSASSVVRETRLRALRGHWVPGALSLVLAPLATTAVAMLLPSMIGPAPWPWWWSLVMGLAWAPLMWLPASPAGVSARTAQALSGLAMVAVLTLCALVAHALPLGIADSPDPGLGRIALAGMLALYLGQALVQRQPLLVSRWRRWSYAGFYLDEAFTRLALRIWPTRWTSVDPSSQRRPVAWSGRIQTPR